MRLLAYIADFCPAFVTGAEKMVEDYLLGLQDRGHHVDVCAVRHGPNGHHSLNILKEPDWEKYDVILTQGGAMGTAFNKAKKFGKRVICFVHNNYQYSFRPHVNVVLNSRFSYDTTPEDLDNVMSATVLQPILRFPEGKSIGDNITLVNCSENKGAKVFEGIASKMPEERFLAVKGHYGKQLELRGDNLTQIEPTSDIQSVLRATKLLVVPSYYESFGRLPVEGMAMGIPVVVANVGGMPEACGNGAVYVSDHKRSSWVKAIQKAMKEDRSKERDHQIQKLKQQATFDLQKFESLCASGSSKNPEPSYKGMKVVS